MGYKITTDGYIEIEFSSSTTTCDEIEDYATCIEGTIKRSDEQGQEKVLGRVRLYYLDIGATYDANIDPFDLFDVRSETEPFYWALIDDMGWFKSELETMFGEYILAPNILVVDRLEVLPEFRGKNIGLACLQRCIQQYAHDCGVVALRCFPLQFEGRDDDARWRRKMKFGKLSKDFDQSLAKLKQYYGSLGFMPLSDGEIMVAFVE